MTAKIHDATSYSFRKADSLLIDANIWIYIYGPQVPKDRRSRDYSSVLKKILEAKCSVFLDVLILSEFINSYSRHFYNLEKELSRLKPFKSYKSYRKSSAFKPVAKDISNAARSILKHCKCIESNIASIDMNTLLADYKSKCPDFNDQILVELCKSRSLKFVTHDGDFRNFDITVLTTNRKLLGNR